MRHNRSCERAKKEGPGAAYHNSSCGDIVLLCEAKRMNGKAR